MNVVVMINEIVIDGLGFLRYKVERKKVSGRIVYSAVFGEFI